MSACVCIEILPEIQRRAAHSPLIAMPIGVDGLQEGVIVLSSPASLEDLVLTGWQVTFGNHSHVWYRHRLHLDLAPALLATVILALAGLAFGSPHPEVTTSPDQGILGHGQTRGQRGWERERQGGEVIGRNGDLADVVRTSRGRATSRMWPR